MPSRSVLSTFLIVAWSAGAVAFLLLQAAVRLLPRALEALESSSLPQLLAYAACVALLGYTEGYKAFHRQFIPRVVARTQALLRRPDPLRVLFGPLFVMSLFDATRRRLVISWTVTLGVVLLILIVQQLPMPWRGMVSGGVVISLLWGVARMVQLFGRAVTGTLAPVDPELATPGTSTS